MNFAIIFVSILFGLMAAAAVPEVSAIVKEREKKSEVTASQQTSGEMDLYLISRIRQDIVAEKDLSMSAKNVKIIALDGQVILKGPVRNKDEMFRVLKFARSAAGVSNVVNEMTIEPEKK